MRSWQTKERLASYAPFLSLVFSLLLAAQILRWNLAREAESFQTGFMRQNLSALASGDILALSRTLESLTGGYHWNCIEGIRGDEVFYSRKLGSCREGFLSREVNFGLPGNRDIRIRAKIIVPPDLLMLTLLLVAGQVVLLAMLVRSGRVLERSEVDRFLEKERAENETNRSLAAMTAMLAHDARRPLSITKMAIEMLGQARDLESVHETISKISPELERAVVNVDALISDVMEIANHKNEVKSEPNEISGVIEASLSEVFRAFPHSDIRVHKSFNHEHAVAADGLKLQRVFSNIIANAIEAMAPRGKIWLTTSERDGFLHLSIKNSGSYINEESRANLFQLFYTAGKKEGTGLGLAIAKKMIEAHRGEIWCESSRTEDFPDGFVDFQMTIPLAQPLTRLSGTVLPQVSSENSAPVGLISDAEALHTPSAPQIALIEDSLMMADAWEMKLGPGTRIHIFEKPDDFLRQVDEDPEWINRLDCVITDYYFELSDKTGGDLATAVKLLRSDIPVVMSTDRPTAPKGGPAGSVDHVIGKRPRSYHEIREMIAKT